MKTYKIQCYDEIFEIRLVAHSYANNGRLAVQSFIVPDGEPFATITVNIDCPLSGDRTMTAFIDTNNLDYLNIENFLQENQIATPTGKYGQSGFCTYPEYCFDLSKF